MSTRLTAASIAARNGAGQAVGSNQTMKGTTMSDQITADLLRDALPPEAPEDLSDGMYAQAAVTAYLGLIFKQGLAAHSAAQFVAEELTAAGFRGKAEFGFSAGDNLDAVWGTRSEDSAPGRRFTGPYMRFTNRHGKTHILEIGVELDSLLWIDGIA